MEAGLLGTLNARIDGEPGGFEGFVRSVRRFGLRLILVGLGRFLALAGGPLLAVAFLPVGIVAVIPIGYAIYGWSFLVVRDDGVTDALGATLALARDGGAYLRFAVAHVVAGAVASVSVTSLVRNAGLPGVFLATAVVVAVYGLLLFRELRGGESSPGLARRVSGRPGWVESGRYRRILERLTRPVEQPPGVDGRITRPVGRTIGVGRQFTGVHGRAVGVVGRR